MKNKASQQMNCQTTSQIVFEGNPAILSFYVTEILQLLQVGVIKDELPGINCNGSEEMAKSVVLSYDQDKGDVTLCAINREAFDLAGGGGQGIRQARPIQVQREASERRRLLEALDRCAHYENEINCGFVFEIPFVELAEIAQGEYRFLVFEVYKKAVRFYGAGIPCELFFETQRRFRN